MQIQAGARAPHVTKRRIAITTEQRTIEFHQAFGHPVRDEPQTLDMGEALLALSLIEEEFMELVQALFPGHPALREPSVVSIILNSTPGAEGTYEPSLVEVADALADLDVVINGAGIRHGLDMQALGREVARSNDSKLGADGKPIYRKDGKIQKGPNFSEPDVRGALGI